MKTISIWDYQDEELEAIRKDYPLALNTRADVVGHLIRTYKVVKGQLDDWGRELTNEKT